MIHPASTCVNKKKIPQVSIGMPVFNGEKYIRDALDSLLAQTFTDFELIISDNASTDSTEEICREYCKKDGRLRYFRQNENVGAVANFQFVLDSARAPIFMWAAYDDQWTKGFLKCAVEKLKRKKILFVFPSFKLKSIYLKIEKRFNKQKFLFIKKGNKKYRVLEFLKLHHREHKCNIVYSVIKIKVLKKILETQSINNDGIFGCLLLSKGTGDLIKNEYFIKRYKIFWPGMTNWWHRLTKPTNSKMFLKIKNTSLNRLYQIFPTYKSEIKKIFKNYNEF